MKLGLIVLTSLLLVCAGCKLGAGDSSPAETGPPPELTARENPLATPTRFVNGNWYRIQAGTVSFAAGDRCQANGLFVADCPDNAAVIDLEGAFVIPALGDAHNHNVDGPWTSAIADRYLQNGVFYMRNLNSVNSVDTWAAPAWDSAENLDIAWAHAGISVDEGHPETLYRNLAQVYRIDAEALEGDVFWDAPDTTTLEAKWPAILETGPDWIKLFLIFTELEGEEPLAGLDRDVFARAVELTHEAGLKAIVHINTAEDFRTAVRLGADGAAHLPPVYIRADEEDATYLLSAEDASAAAEAGFITTPTAALVEFASASEGVSEATMIQYDRAKRLQAANFAMLRDHGAPIALGSDLYQGDATDELRAIAARGVFSDAALLKIAVETPSTSIFPDRAIGTLAPGWEASFIALACNPAEAISCVGEMTLRIKQGALVGDTETAQTG